VLPLSRGGELIAVILRRLSRGYVQAMRVSAVVGSAAFGSEEGVLVVCRSSVVGVGVQTIVAHWA
jgi:hypothetical protein